MGAIGERIRKERERLGLSQAEFAEKAGISRMTQVNYESGKRTPDINYLEAIAKAGVDVSLLLFGESPSEWANTVFAMLLALMDRLNIPAGSFLHAANILYKKALEGKSEKDEAAQVVNYLLDSYGIDGDGTLEPELLVQVLEPLESQLSARRITLAPREKAQAIVMLYRSFKASGKIDDKMIEDAISLAS